MFSDQLLKARMTLALVAMLAGLAAGCSSSESMTRETVGTTVVPPAPAPMEPEVELTATEAAVAKADSQAGAVASQAPSDSAGILNPNAPKSYTVKRGDTLWDISAMFLRDPWLWPEVWYVNPQIENPHLIYPGDVLTLAYGANGQPQIRLERGGAARLEPRLRSTPLDSAIPPIPYGAIAAFLSRPSLLSSEDVKRAPHVLAFRDGHMVGGAGNEIYVRNLKAPENARFSVVHIGQALRDPDNGDILGYHGIYTATAMVTNPGDPAKAVLSDSERETLEGDRLFSTDVDTPLNFVPRAPATEVRGQIIAVANGSSLIGQHQVVAINRGKRHGVDAGHVLAVDSAGAVVRDRASARRIGGIGFGSSFAPRVKLPDERAGTLLVFKSYDRMSYALVMGASAPMRVADVVRNP